MQESARYRFELSWMLEKRSIGKAWLGGETVSFASNSLGVTSSAGVFHSHLFLVCFSLASWAVNC